MAIPRRRARLAAAFAAAAAALLFGGVAEADNVYKWVDESGTANFSDELPPSGRSRYRVIKRDYDSPEDGSSAPTATGVPPVSTPPDRQRKASRGADVKTPARGGKTPLLLALERGRFPEAESLIRNGAPTRGPGLDGMIVEYMMHGKPEAARFLIRHGGDVEAATALGTPLQNAIRLGRKDIVEELLEQGADIGRRDGEGWTPLMFAAVCGSREIAELLVGNGAEVASRNSRGQTAATIAAEAGWTELASYLRAQANP